MLRSPFPKPLPTRQSLCPRSLFQEFKDYQKGVEILTIFLLRISLSLFYYATKQLRQPFEDVLKEMCNSDSSTPICVTSDVFLPWTLDSCRMFNIPRIVCGGMGVLPVVIARSVSLHVPCLPSLSNSEPINLASVPFPIHKNDSPGSVRPGDDNNPMRAILA